MSEKKVSNFVTIGDVLVSKDRDGTFEATEDGVPKKYYLKVYVPKDVDEAGIGEPSVVFRKGDYLNLRLPTEKDLEIKKKSLEKADPEFRDKILADLQLIAYKKKIDAE